MKRICLGLALLAAVVLPASGADLFRDDFSRFPPGWLTFPVGTLNGAIQEYHYLPHRGVPLGPWENAIAHLDCVMRDAVLELDGRVVMAEGVLP